MPMLPILPGPISSGPTPAAAGASPSAAAPADPTSDPSGGATFVDQLAAALASLGPATPNPQPEVPAEPSSDADPEQARDSQTSDQTMVDLAASFGLLPLPPLMPMPMPINAPAAATGSADGQAAGVASASRPAMLTAAMLGAAVATAAAPQSGPTDAAASADAQPEQGSSAGDQPSTARPRSETAAPAAGAVPAQAPNALSQHPGTPEPQPAATTQPLHPAGQAHHAAASGPTSDTRPVRGPGEPRRSGHAEVVTTTPAGQAQAAQQLATGSEAQAGAHGEGEGHAQTADQDATAARQTPEATSPDGTAQPAPVSAVAGAAAAAAPGAPDAAHPRGVVAQIAQQAELYRLPGGRGVRIQLHPDGLGGVEVTLRYGNAGALELHVNVEHAATGALVQAGWSDLRDALSLQGISPDRLVMSVSGPDGANLSSDSGSFGGSGSGGSFRADTGAMGFGQSSQGQQEHQAASGARSRWTPSLEAAPQEEHAAAASSSSSRIDLRV